MANIDNGCPFNHQTPPNVETPPVPNYAWLLDLLKIPLDTSVLDLPEAIVVKILRIIRGHRTVYSIMDPDLRFEAKLAFIDPRIAWLEELAGDSYYRLGSAYSNIQRCIESPAVNVAYFSSSSLREILHIDLPDSEREIVSKLLMSEELVRQPLLNYLEDLRVAGVVELFQGIVELRLLTKSIMRKTIDTVIQRLGLMDEISIPKLAELITIAWTHSCLVRSGMEEAEQEELKISLLQELAGSQVWEQSYSWYPKEEVGSQSRSISSIVGNDKQKKAVVAEVMSEKNMLVSFICCLPQNMNGCMALASDWSWETIWERLRLPQEACTGISGLRDLLQHIYRQWDIEGDGNSATLKRRKEGRVIRHRPMQ